MTSDELIAMARRGASVPDQLDALMGLLREAGAHPATVAAVCRRVVPGIALRRAADGNALARIGGAPVLPVGVDWPRGRDGWPHRFIGAFDLGRLPALAPLPSRGVLLLYRSFTLSPEAFDDALGNTRVFWTQDPARLVPVAEPPPSEDPAIGEVPLTGAVMPIVGELDRLRRELDAAESLAQAAAVQRATGPPLFGDHRLLGAPRAVQDTVLGEIPLHIASFSEEGRARYSDVPDGGWIQLAEIHEEPPDGLYIGDGGSLYFVMPREDLERRRFNRAFAIMQSA
jgi:hypothetical protein